MDIEILRDFDDSMILQAIEASNLMKVERESKKLDAELARDQATVQTA